jgi:hypothetical protein
MVGVMLVGALALLAAACGSSGDESTGSAAATAAATAATPTPTPTETETPTATPDKDAGTLSAAAEQDCDKVGDIAGSPKLAPPADLPIPGDAHVYESQGPFGKTTRFFASAAGGPDDLPRVRDDATDALVENGYRLLSKDQEKDAEAESHVTGKHTVDVQVINLCKGKLRIRYTVS